MIYNIRHKEFDCLFKLGKNFRQGLRRCNMPLLIFFMSFVQLFMSGIPVVTRFSIGNYRYDSFDLTL